MANKNLEKEVSGINITNILNDINMQTKIINIILDPMQHDFREQILDVIDLSFFESAHHKNLLQIVLKYINKFNLVPPRDTLKQSIQISTKDNILRNHLYELTDIVFDYDLKDKEFVMEITLDFFRKQSLKKS